MIPEGIVRREGGRMVLLVLDGLGGLQADGCGTELEEARTPNLDRLATEGVCGLHQPVGAGVTPGSGPAHLALFGYDPLRYVVGRGVLSALGIGFELRRGDVAARGNFAKIGEDGRIEDRRAGRLSSDKGRELAERLESADLGEVEVSVKPIKEHRFLLVLRGESLGEAVSDTDPGRTGLPARTAVPLDADAERTADAVDRFVRQAEEILAGEEHANGVLLRGFGRRPEWPGMRERYGLEAAALASYPMYRGVASLVGMRRLEVEGGLGPELDLLESEWESADFWFVHEKGLDSAGEDGDFERRVRLLEEFDSLIPRLAGLRPDVLIVTGDHSTPAALAGHSWHPVPMLLSAPSCRPDAVTRFGETACIGGGLGPRFPATDLMPLALAHAGRLGKYGP